jgi:hypothetical protein
VICQRGDIIDLSAKKSLTKMYRPRPAFQAAKAIASTLKVGLLQFELSTCKKTNCTFIETSHGTAAVARFFTLKKLNPEDIQAEFISRYGPNRLALSTLYKCHKRFIDGRIEPCDDP